MPEQTPKRAHLLHLADECERLRTALSWFLEDKRFVVSVGGNPIMLDRMLACARAILEGRAVVEILPKPEDV